MSNNKFIGLPEEAARWYQKLLDKERLAESNSDFLTKLEKEQSDALNKLSIAVENGLNNLRSNIIADYTAEQGIDISKQVDKERLRAKNFKTLNESNTANSFVQQLPLDLKWALGENDSEEDTDSDYLNPVFEALSLAIGVIRDVEKIIANRQDSDSIKLANIGICLANKWEKNKDALQRKLSVVADYEAGNYEKGDYESQEPMQYNK